MQRQQRQGTLRREGGGIPRRAASRVDSRVGSRIDTSTWPLSQPRRCRDKQMRGTSASSSRFARWPKNVFFASDFVAHKNTAAAATSTKTEYHVQRSRSRSNTTTTNTRATISTSRRKVQRETRDMGDAVGNKAERRRRKSVGHAESVRTKTAGRFVDNANVLQADDRGDQEKRSALTVGVSERGRFLQESASALLHLHRRYFGRTTGEEDLVCRLCVLCREAGWMGNPRSREGPCSALDPFAVEELLLLRLRDTKRANAQQEMEREHHRDKWQQKNCHSANSVIFSFEGFYGVLSDIAGVVYSWDTEELQQEGGNSRRAMHRLLVEGVLPLAKDPVPRLWSPRPEILFGRPALAALRTQRDALHQLYHTYNGKGQTQSGATGFRRTTFVQMLADLGVLPASVSEVHAASVFDAVVRNGLPDTEPARGKELYYDGVFDVHCIGRGGRGSEGIVRDTTAMIGRKARRRREDTRKHEESRLCWSLFLEAMAALAVEAVEDRRGELTTNTRCCNTSKRLANGRSRPQMSGGTRCHDDDVQESTNVVRKARSGQTHDSVFPVRWSSTGTVGAGRSGNGRESESDAERQRSEGQLGEGKIDVDMLTSTDVHATVVSTSTTARDATDARGFRHGERMVDVVPTELKVKDHGEQRHRAVIRQARSPRDTRREALEQRKGNRDVSDVDRETKCVRQPLSQSCRTTLLSVDAECAPAVEPKRHHFTGNCRGNTVPIQGSTSGKYTSQKATSPSPGQAVPLLVGRHLARMADQTGCKAELGSSNTRFFNRPTSERSEGGRQREEAEAIPHPRTVCAGPGIEGGEVGPYLNGKDDAAMARSSANRIFEAGVAMGRGVKSGKPQDPGISTGKVCCSCTTDGGCGVNPWPPVQPYRLVDPWTGHAQQRHTNKMSDSKLLDVGYSRNSVAECNGTEPAPCHGGSPFSEPRFFAHVAADRVDRVKDPTPVYLGRPSAQEFVSMLTTCPFEHPFVEDNAVKTVRDDNLRSRNNGSVYAKVTEASVRSSSIISRSSTATDSRARGKEVRTRDFVAEAGVHDFEEKHNATVETSHGETDKTCSSAAKAARDCSGDVEGEGMRRSDDDETRGRSHVHDHHQITRVESGMRATTMEAAGCTAALFEELLDPKVVSIYLRCHNQLTALFQRYRSDREETVQGSASSEISDLSVEPSGFIRDEEIRRFVDDFPALRERWGRDKDSLHLLHLLVRASHGRESRRRLRVPTRKKSMASTGLCYWGFLEVLTRMAHAADGRAPLHDKLEALLLALQTKFAHGVS